MFSGIMSRVKCDVGNRNLVWSAQRVREVSWNFTERGEWSPSTQMSLCTLNTVTSV